MCLSAAAWAAVGAGVSASAAVYNADQQRKSAHAAMDAARADAMRAEVEPTQMANGRLAARRRALASQSLLTDQAGGRATLGG